MSGLRGDAISQIGENGGIHCDAKSERPGWWEITISSSWLTLPLTILTAALVAYVFKHQVRTDDNISPFLNQDFSIVPNDGAIYVQVDSTMLVFLASWMSSVAPLLVGFAIYLATFPITQHLMRDTMGPGRMNHLPTSLQLRFMLKLINGATSAGLWGLLTYRWRRKQRSGARDTALISLISVTIISILFSAVIFAADTWLHMATTTVSLNVPHSMAVQEVDYGFGSLPTCLKTNNSIAAMLATNTSCTYDATFAPQLIFKDPTSTTLTVNDRSPVTSVVHVSNSNLSYLGIPITAQESNYDFKAATYGSRAACTSISQGCNLTIDGNITFSCNGGNFAAEGGEMAAQGNLALQTFKYANLSDYTDYEQAYGVPNPFYIAGATANGQPTNSSFVTDGGVVLAPNTIGAVYLCQITILDLEYTSIRGNVNVVSERVSNESVTNMFASGIAASTFGQDTMKVNLNLAAVIANNERNFTNQFETQLNNAILSSGAGSVQHIPVEVAQTRDDILVARVPKAPFYLLVASNLAFVLLGFCLMTLAINTSADARQAQYQLTTAGLVNKLFDRNDPENRVDAVEQLFTQYYEQASDAKIGIDRTSKGGFELTPINSAR